LLFRWHFLTELLGLPQISISGGYAVSRRSVEITGEDENMGFGEKRNRKYA
jgi:hypothetical protein